MKSAARLRRVLFCAAVLAALSISEASAAPKRTGVWIDTDPAIGPPWREVDDAFALVLAFHSPELAIAGISSTYGNAGLNRTTSVARDLVRRFGSSAALSPSEVHRGASSARDATLATDATKALAAALRERQLTYIALGPLTNLAAFLHLHPELAHRIDRVIFIGGRSPDRPIAFGPKRSFTIHDANVFKDPQSAAAVVNSGIPITLCGAELAPQLALTRKDLAQLRGSASGDFLRSRTRVWLWFWTSVVREKGGLVFDVLAILPAIRPDLLRTESRFAQFDRSADLIVERSPSPRSRAVRFSSRVNPEAKPLLIDRLRGSAKQGSATAPRPRR